MQEVAELELPEHLLQLRPVGRREDELRHVAVQLEVAAHRRQLLRLPGLLGVLEDVLLAGRRELLCVRDHLLDRAVLADQLAGRLVADPGDAGDVVRGVALEPDEVRHLVGANAVASLDAIRRVDVDVGDAARGHHQRDVLGDELEGVAVGGDDGGLDPRFVRLRRERRDHIVCFPALELEVPVAEGLDDRAEVRELLTQEVRHRPTLGLVVLRDRGPVHRVRVPGDGDALRLVVGQELEEHVREAEQRVRREALARGELLGEGEEGAVGEVVAVDEEELGIADGAVVELELCARESLRHRPTVSSYGDAGAGDSAVRRGAPRWGRRPARGAPCTPPRGRARPARERRLSRGDRGAMGHGRTLRSDSDPERRARRLPARSPSGRRELGLEHLGRICRPRGS